MSTKYEHPKEVPLQVIAARLNELATAITKGRDSQEREFTMRIPAECDRDADIVINEAANRIGALQARVAELESSLTAMFYAMPPCDTTKTLAILTEAGRVIETACPETFIKRKQAEAVDNAFMDLATSIRKEWLNGISVKGLIHEATYTQSLNMKEQGE